MADPPDQVAPPLPPDHTEPPPVAIQRPWHTVGVPSHRGSAGINLYLWCVGCDELHGVEVASGPPKWEWDGNLEAPTISPSILVNGVQWPDDSGFHKPKHTVEPGQPTVCHSYVRAGQWEYLGDCTHTLVGQTVPLPPLPAWFVEGKNA